MTRRHPLDGGIYGYMFPDQLTWISDQARQRWRILELGAYLGRTTVAIAGATQGVVHVVDHCQGAPNDPCPSGPEVMGEFLDNIKEFRNVTVWDGESGDMWRAMGHLPFDMVWIDAYHDYEAVARDIRLWKSYLDQPGGLLCGHDAEYPGVRRAIEELVPDQTWGSPRTDTSLIWFKEE